MAKTENEKLKSQAILSDFTRPLRRFSVANGNLQFDANVQYEFRGKTLMDRMWVMVSKTTWEAGNIQMLEDTPNISSVEVHTDFTPGFQDYELTNGCLVISGESDKMGRYRVTIGPPFTTHERQYD